MKTITVELHCHTCYSPDSILRPADLLRTARHRGLDKVAITDHNTIEGALEAAALDPERVIIGEEIFTTKGELLAYFLREYVPPRLSPRETIDRLRDQGAIISVSHPFDPYRKGAWQPEDLKQILPLIDGLEVFNARMFSSAGNVKAAQWAEREGLAGTAGSDAHARAEMGQAVMRLPEFNGPQEFLAALRQGEIEGTLSSPFVHFYSRWAVWRKKRGWHH